MLHVKKFLKKNLQQFSSNPLFLFELYYYVLKK